MQGTTRGAITAALTALALVALGAAAQAPSVAATSSPAGPPPVVMPPLPGLDLDDIEIPPLPSLRLPAPARAETPAGPAKKLSVDCSKGGKLQKKIDAATSGSTITIEGTCKGNFVIAGKSLTLQGSPTVTLDGKKDGPTLIVDSPGKKVILRRLTITRGKTEQGGGILGQGNIMLDHSTVTGNVAGGSGGGLGGGIFIAGGKLTLKHSVVSKNRASSAAGNAMGGGIVSFVPVALTDSSVDGNRVEGGMGTVAGAAMLVQSRLTVTHSSISRNVAIAKNLTSGASAQGAVLYQAGPTPADGGRIRDSVIQGNRVTVEGKTFALLQFVLHFEGKARIDGTLLANNESSAVSADGAIDFFGGLLVAEDLDIRGSSVRDNTSSAKAKTEVNLQGPTMMFDKLKVRNTRITGNLGKSVSSSDKASAFGLLYGSQADLIGSTVAGNTLSAKGKDGDATGTVVAAMLIVRSSTVAKNSVLGEATAAAGKAYAYAGGLGPQGGKIENSTIAGNRLVATAPATGEISAGGAGFTSGDASIIASTIVGNVIVTKGGATVASQGGGIMKAGSIEASIVANNKAKQGPDCFNVAVSEGYNLVRKTQDCGFTKLPTDITGKDPKVGRLGKNGGPTETTALLTGSPALNRIPKAKCPVKKDQRGVKRPQGTKCDIGAYELKKP